MGATFDLRKELVRTRGELAQRKVRLRPISQVNRRVADLTSLVDRCGLVTGSVQLGKIGPGPKCAVMPLHLSARGSYQACQEFLHGLVEPFSDFAVAGFEIQGDPQRPGLPARFEIDLYWYAASEQTAMN